jgi:hypothetical protein
MSESGVEGWDGIIHDILAKKANSCEGETERPDSVDRQQQQQPEFRNKGNIRKYKGRRF